MAVISLDRMERERAAVSQTCSTAADGEQLLKLLSERLGRLVPFDGATWFATDPATLLTTSPSRIENVESGHCTSYWEREFLVEDAALFRDVARQARPVATLYGATNARPARSARYREFLRPQGYDDELRAVFRLGSASWGIVSLMCERGRPRFDCGEMAVVTSLSGVIAQGLRATALTRFPAITAD